ncbi:hypothetical protein RvY_12842 [Ramazzottius varieornatus]|uniref:Translation initiation factor 3 N-terminal domain-containing protein n=1 Tax=Ramazzottius varieornatus TaxID=947166 RepID=A0A1D1VMV7_RAMVA|nr:hypothetical protein RvY_12842 [Ramazzottius varieornatus]
MDCRRNPSRLLPLLRLGQCRPCNRSNENLMLYLNQLTLRHDWPPHPPSLISALHTSTESWRKKNILQDELPVKTKPLDLKVIVIGHDGEDMGIYTKGQAQELAKKRGMRIVPVEQYPALQESIQRNSVHPIYRLLSGTELFEIQKKDHELRKETKQVAQKILQLTCTASENDVRTKLRQGEAWLRKGDSLKVLILGREDMKARMGELQQQVLTALKAFYKPTISGLSKSDRNISFLLESSGVKEKPIVDSGVKNEEP